MSGMPPPPPPIWGGSDGWELPEPTAPGMTYSPNADGQWTAPTAAPVQTTPAPRPAATPMPQPVSQPVAEPALVQMNRPQPELSFGPPWPPSTRENSVTLIPTQPTTPRPPTTPPSGTPTTPPTGGTGTPPAGTPPSNTPTAPDLSKIPAPEGYAYSINPLTKQLEFIDLTPLDPSQPLSGWHWLPDDPTNPNKGRWTFSPSNNAMQDPYEGIPTPVIGWVQQALSAGGDINVVPEGPAREWVKFILTQATNPGVNRPDETPFGMGLPRFDRTGGGMPTAPGTNPSGGTPGGGIGGPGAGGWIENLLGGLFSRTGFEGRWGPQQWPMPQPPTGTPTTPPADVNPLPGETPQQPNEVLTWLTSFLQGKGLDPSIIQQIMTIMNH